MHQADFLLQQQHLKNVAHGFGVADDVVTDRVRTELAAQFIRLFKNADLRTKKVGVLRIGHAQLACIFQQAQKKLLTLALAE
ncbi:hypothetical protein D3C78_1159330 [compost metagenome]